MTFTWNGSTATNEAGVEGSTISLGTIIDNVFTGNSSILSGIPVGSTVSDASGNSFTATTGHTSVDISNWDPLFSGGWVNLKITLINDANFTLSITDGTTISDVITVSPTAPTLSPTAVGGTEGAAIALSPGLIVTSSSGDTNSLASLVVSAIPVRAVLTDGNGHSFTAAAGSNSVDVTAWTLSGLKITPTNDANFALTFSATDKDAQGNLSTPTTTTESVTVSPTAPTLSPTAVSGTEGAAIALSPGLIVTSSSGDTNSLASLVVSAIPVRAVLTDGNGHSFTAAAGSNSVDVTAWTLSGLKITPTNDANFALTFSATDKDAQGNLSTPTTTTESVTVSPTAPTISDASVVNGYVNAANDTLSQALKGTADAGDTVNVYLNGAVTPAFTAAADASGNWSVPVGALADGGYSYTATASDVDGNTAQSAAFGFTVDTTTRESAIADSAVTIGRDGKSYIIGANFNGGVTTLTGTAEAGDTVSVSVNGAAEAATMAGGAWSLTLNGLIDGTAYSAVATATDPAGNTASSDPFTFTVDKMTSESAISDSAVTTGTDGKSYINAAHIFPDGATALTGLMEPGDIATLSVDYNGSPNFVPVPTEGTVEGTWHALIDLVDGESVSVVATASDVAGNTASSAPLTFTVDTMTSESAIADSAVTIGRDGKSYINGANFNGGVTTLTGTAEAGDTVSVSVNGGTAEAAAMAAGGAWSLTLNGLADGTVYSAVATATDVAGNTASSDPFAFTVDKMTSESAIADFGAVTTGTDGKSYLNAAHIFPDGATALTGLMEPGDIATLSVDYNGSPNFVPVPTEGTVEGTWHALIDLVDGESVSVVATASDVAGNTASSAPLTFTVDTTTSESAIADSAVTIGRDGQNYIIGANFNGGVTTLTGTAEAGDRVSVSVNGAAEAATMAGGAWSLTLNGLIDGTAYSAVATATDPAGNTASSDPFAFIVDADTGEQAALGLTINGGQPIGSAVAATRPFADGTDKGVTIRADRGRHAVLWLAASMPTTTAR